MKDYSARVLGLIKPHKKLYIFGQIAMLATTIAGLAFPGSIKNIFDSAFKNRDLKYLLTSVSILAVVFIVKEVSNYIKNYTLGLIGQRIVTDLRCETYKRLQDIPLAYYGSRKTGDIVSTLTNDINLFQGILTNGVTFIIQGVISLIAVLILLFRIDTLLALSLFSILPAIMLVSKIMGERIKSISAIVQEKLGNITSIINETVSGIDVIKGFTLEKHAICIFNHENNVVMDKSVQAVKVKSSTGMMNGLLNSLYLLLITGFGAYRVFNGHITPGELIAFVLYTEMIYGPIASLSDIYMEIQRSAASVRRIFEIIDAGTPAQTVAEYAPSEKVKGGITFDNVSFAYSSKAVLQNINIEISPGETIALIGASGVGKSTLMKLIPRFYEVCSGKISIDGIDIKDINTSNLRKIIAAVPQETYLFGMKISDNIACGKPEATCDEIINAAKMANAHDFIIKLDKGYDTEVGEKGASLSGGQKQRIAIARAFIKNPRILLLDEATASLDSESESKVLEALKKLMTGRTTIISAHRLSTIEKANRVVVLENGQIAAIGTHKELLQSSQVYNTLMLSGMKSKLLMEM